MLKKVNCRNFGRKLDGFSFLLVFPRILTQKPIFGSTIPYFGPLSNKELIVPLKSVSSFSVSLKQKWPKLDSTLMSLVAHQFGHVKFRISLDVFYRQVETIKKKIRNSKRPNRCSYISTKGQIKSEWIYESFNFPKYQSPCPKYVSTSGQKSFKFFNWYFGKLMISYKYSFWPNLTFTKEITTYVQKPARYAVK